MAISIRQEIFKTNGIVYLKTHKLPSSFHVKNMQNFKLTRRRAHPVGVKARIAANKSDIVSLCKTKRKIMTDMKPRNKGALRILNKI